MILLDGQANTGQPGGEGGTLYPDICPQGQVVVGYNGSVNPNALRKDGMPITIIGSLQTICGRLVIDAMSDLVRIVLGETLLPLRGEEHGATWTSVCPDDKVVMGFTGSSGVAFDQIALQCTQLQITKGPSGDVVSVNTSTYQILPPNGGDAGSFMYTEVCPDGKIAQGSNIRAGAWVDAFGLACATPSIVIPVDAGACCGSTTQTTSARALDQAKLP